MSSNFKSKKEEEDFEYNFNRYFGALLNLVALAIIISIIVFFFNNYKKNEQIKFEKEISKIDTLNFNVNLKDSISVVKLNASLSKQINSLNKLKSDIEKSDEIKKDDIKFYFSLIGFILAIVGFFGFKSIHDSKEIAIKNAADEAKTVTKNILDSETKKIIAEKLQEFSETIDEIKGDYEELRNSLDILAELQGDISDLRIRVEELQYIMEDRDNEDGDEGDGDDGDGGDGDNENTTENDPKNPVNPSVNFDEFNDNDEFK